MLRIFKKIKPVHLGRWDTAKSNEAILRQIDLANCDSCGTCTVPNQKKIKVHMRERYLFVEGDVIDLGYIPLPGSFELHRKS